MKRQFFGIPASILPLILVLSILATVNFMIFVTIGLSDPLPILIVWSVISIVMIRRFYRRFYR